MVRPIIIMPLLSYLMTLLTGTNVAVNPASSHLELMPVTLVCKPSPLTLSNVTHNGITIKAPQLYNSVTGNCLQFYIKDSITNVRKRDSIKFTPIQIAANKDRPLFLIVKDSCANDSMMCKIKVLIRDLTSPELACKLLDVNISSSIDFIPATTFVARVKDNVTDSSLIKIEAARMVAGCGATTAFGPRVNFCCADVNTNVTVIVRATDEAGNANTCMVAISVNDKILPRVVDSLKNIRVSCDYNINLANLNVFGKYVSTEAARQNIVINDPLFMSLAGPFRDGLMSDNCTVTITELAPIDQRSHNAGNIIRRFVGIDGDGNRDTVTQIITVVDVDPMVLADITWPADYTYTDCSQMPPSETLAGKPTFRNDDVCSIPASSKSDKIFDDPTSGCIYIMRTWTVIDWAQYRPNTNIGKWTYVQDIHLVNTVKPIFSAATCNAKSICAENSLCDALVALSASATDDCTDTDDLVFSYKIDLLNDGTVDQNGTGNAISRRMPRGLHRVTWSVEDRCGNVQTCDVMVTVKECKAPIPICLNGLSTNLENDATAVIWAKDFNNKSNDNCTAESELKFSFSANTNNTSRTLTCADRGNVNISMWVTDLEGNQSRCNTFITVTDLKRLCPSNNTNNGSEMLSISGRIGTEDNAYLSDIKVVAKGSSLEKEIMTDQAGNYEIKDLPKNASLDLSVEKNNDWHQGISTLDLVMIQRHILGTKHLESPYKIIAADADNNQKLSASDLVQLRKLILGKIEFIPGNTSWRFVKKDFVFNDPKNPWPFMEILNYDSLLTHQFNTDFIAIKTGDVSNTISGNILRGQVDNRTVPTIELTVNEQNFAADKHLNIGIKLEEDVTIQALQFKYMLDPNKVDFKGILSSELTIEDENYHFNPNTGELNILIQDTKSKTLRKGSTLFAIQCKAKTDARISEVLSLPFTNENSIVLEDLSILRWNLLVTDDASPLSVQQNQPNPFSNYTDVQFKLAEDSKVSFTIFGSSGEEIFHQVQDYKYGTHSLRIGKEELGDRKGVFFLHIATGEAREMKKLLRID